MNRNSGKQGSLERRKSYLRGLLTVNCNHFKMDKIDNSWSNLKTMKVIS